MFNRISNNILRLLLLFIAGISSSCVSSSPTTSGLPSRLGPGASTLTPTESRALWLSAHLSESGRIAFISDRDGQSDVYATNLGQSGLSRLTFTKAVEKRLLWSPDGTKIAFISDQTATDQIYEVEVAEGSITQVTRSMSSIHDWRWASDNQTIFLVDFLDGTEKVYRVKINTSSEELVNARIPLDAHVVLSPDLQQLLVWGYVKDDYYIITTNLDGTGAQFVAKGQMPVWSPDGQRVAFWQFEYDEAALCVIEAGSPTASTIALFRRGSLAGEILYSNPLWSPNGTEIALEIRRGRSGYESGALYIVDLAGYLDEWLDQAEHLVAEGTNLSWSPDGTLMAFVSGGSTNSDIYVLDPLTLARLNLTDLPASYWSVLWAP